MYIANFKNYSIIIIINTSKSIFRLIKNHDQFYVLFFQQKFHILCCNLGTFIILHAHADNNILKLLEEMAVNHFLFCPLF